MFFYLSLFNIIAQVISLHPEQRNSLPETSPATFTCTVVGRAIWTVGPDVPIVIDTFFGIQGNITDGLSSPINRPIQLFDYSDNNEYNVSVLVLLPEYENRNNTEVSCDATTTGFDRGVIQRSQVQLYGILLVLDNESA